MHKARLYVRSIRILLIAACIFSFGLMFLQSFSVFADSPITISIDTGRNLYSSGEAVSISGRILDSTMMQEGQPLGVMAKVEIEITRLDDGEIMYQASTVSDGKGFFFDSGFRTPERGNFLIKVIARVSDESNNVTAISRIKSIPAFSLSDVLTEPYMGLSVAMPVAIAFLLVLGRWPIKQRLRAGEKLPWLTRLIGLRPSGFYLWQFFFLTVVTVSPILSFVFFPRQIGSDAPVGLVIDQVSVGEETIASWVFNIGGTSDGLSYTGGLSIPVYVVVLGLLGAYIAYLRKFPDSIRNVKEMIKGTGEEEEKS